MAVGQKNSAAVNLPEDVDSVTDDNVRRDEHSIFAVPNDFDFPDALIYPAPRQLPDSFVRMKNAEYYSYQIFFTLIAVSCIFLSGCEWIRFISLYFLPLAFLNWLGVTILIIQFFAVICHKLFETEEELYQHGKAVPALIDSIELKAESLVKGVETQYFYYANIIFVPPGEPYLYGLTVKSKELKNPDDYCCTYKAGDYVSALCLPDGTVNLYGFLGITGDEGVIKYEPEKSCIFNRATRNCLKLMILPLILVAMFWKLYALSKYAPLEEPVGGVAVSFLLGYPVGITIMFMWLVSYLSRRDKIKRRKLAVSGEVTLKGRHWLWTGHNPLRWCLRIMLFMTVPLICSTTIYSWAISINALLDNSMPQTGIAKVDKIVTKTHGIVFRQYSVEFYLPDSGNKIHSYLVSPAGIKDFTGCKMVEIDICRGRFGWSWVKDIYPVSILDSNKKE